MFLNSFPLMFCFEDVSEQFIKAPICFILFIVNLTIFVIKREGKSFSLVKQLIKYPYVLSLIIGFSSSSSSSSTNVAVDLRLTRTAGLFSSNCSFEGS